MTLPILLRNILAASVSFVGSTVWTSVLVRIASSKRLSAPTTRKLMHISTAPLFTLTWPLYVHGTANVSARVLAACVPLSFALRIARRPAENRLVQEVARDSDKRRHATPIAKALGPMAYAVSISAITAASWTSPHTFVALAALCFGDGMADVIGSTINKMPFPLRPKTFFIKKKTIPGSLAFFLATVPAAAAWQRLPLLFPLVSPTAPRSIPILPLPHIAAVAAVCTLVELLPFEDNYTVPLTALVMSTATGRQLLSSSQT